MSADIENSLSIEELQRYSRHLILPEVGAAGQKRLKRARVLLVGMGGLGAPASMYLAAAGVGRLGMVDFDQVDVTNLQRQITCATSDVGNSKLQAARERLHGINPNVQIDLHEVRLDSSNALTILESYDVVIDGTDNFATRYLVNDACFFLGKPNFYGSIYRFEGQASVFCAPEGPCYRCLFEKPPPANAVPNCAEAGVLGVLPGIIGCIQAMEAIKFILNLGQTLVGRLLIFDALSMRFRELSLKKDPNCVLCGSEPSITSLQDYETFCGTSQTEDPKMDGLEITVLELEKRLKEGRETFVLDVRESHEWDVCHLEQATLIPMQEIPQRLGEVPQDQDVIVYCKLGMRSAKVTEFLRDQGFARAWSLQGGIKSWVEQVDPSMPTYW